MGHLLSGNPQNEPSVLQLGNRANETRAPTTTTDDTALPAEQRRKLRSWCLAQRTRRGSGWQGERQDSLVLSRFSLDTNTSAFPLSTVSKGSYQPPTRQITGAEHSTWHRFVFDWKELLLGPPSPGCAWGLSESSGTLCD